MFPLVRFFEDDVNESPYVETVVPHGCFLRLFPGTSIVFMLFIWLGGLLFGKAKVAKGRAKVRKARAEILPRSPNSLICPNCHEVLERM